ncbi:MAG TPA: DNA methyltransferase, partial [Jiangellaceae bacterium]|nr:DNA methyltransferase [Jiangellaceae bacterium]
MTAILLRGNALHLPLPDASVDLVVTSPPYFGLRSYRDDGEHYAGQIGAEATPQEFLDALIAATREMARVLKPAGSIFVNLGDKFSGAQQQSSGRQSTESS